MLLFYLKKTIYNKSVELINYASGNLLTHFKRYVERNISNNIAHLTSAEVKYI